MNTRLLFLSLILSLLSISLSGQKTTIEGFITSFGDIPVNQAEIISNKSKTATKTDSLGYFTIDCERKEKLSISAAGFKTESVRVKKLKASEPIDIDIDGNESQLDLAISKGHISKIYAPLAKKRILTKKVFSQGFNNMKDLLKGKFPQLTVTSDEVIMRGSSSLYGSNGVLFAISGSTYSWSQVNTIDVLTLKNIEILTGSAATRYGPGSGNGVIRIDLLTE
ncbi:MAG: hypothetical protein ACI9FN_003399 [Saprospiraceae bacterium]|jgi:hypothetical protein